MNKTCAVYILGEYWNPRSENEITATAAVAATISPTCVGALSVMFETLQRSQLSLHSTLQNNAIETS
jgi:hypothetical protein